MKFFLPVNRVVDYNAKVRVNSDGSGLEKLCIRINHVHDVPIFSMVDFDLEVDFSAAMPEVANSDVFQFPTTPHSMHASTRSNKETGNKRC